MFRNTGHVLNALVTMHKNLMKKLYFHTISGCRKPEASLGPMIVTQELVAFAVEFEGTFTTEAEGESADLFEKASIKTSAHFCNLE